MNPNELDYATLNPGIRATVRLLNALGYETTSSGDGMTHECPECDPDYPYVTIATPARKVHKTVNKLARLIGGLGLEVGSFTEDGKPDGIGIMGNVWPRDDVAKRAGYAFVELAGLDDNLLLLALTGPLDPPRAWHPEPTQWAVKQKDGAQVLIPVYNNKLSEEPA